MASLSPAFSVTGCCLPLSSVFLNIFSTDAAKSPAEAAAVFQCDSLAVDYKIQIDIMIFKD